MALYFGKPASQGQYVPAHLKNKGIYLTRVNPSFMGAVALPKTEQPLFTVYRNNLPAYITAWAIATDVALNWDGYPITVMHPSYRFPHTNPQVIISFDKTPDSTLMSTMESMGVRISVMEKKKAYILARPDAAALQSIMPHKPKEDVPVGPLLNTCSLNGFKASKTIISVFSGFYLTHQYPSHPDNRAASLSIMVNVDKPDPKRKRAGAEAGSSTRTRVRNRDTGEISYVEDEEMDDTMTEYEEPKERKARAPKTKGHVGWGTPVNFPNSSGMWFPFEKDLAIADQQTVPNVMKQYFLKSLGNTVSSVLTNFGFLSKSWGTVADTDLGKQLTHMAILIDLCLQSQSRAFPIFEGDVYRGTILFGTMFHVKVGQEVREPYSYSELQQAVADTNIHSDALIKILAILKSSDTSNIVPDDHTVIKSARQLNSLIKDLSLAKEDRDKIVALSDCLRFESYFWPITEARLIELVSVLIGESTMSVEEPLANSLILSEDPYALALGVFGEFAPSLNVPTGRKYVFGEESSKDFFTGLGKDDGTLVVANIAVAQAAKDMRAIAENNVIYQNPMGRSTGSRYNTFDTKQRVAILAKVLELGKKMRTAPVGPVGSAKVAALPEGDIFGF